MIKLLDKYKDSFEDLNFAQKKDIIHKIERSPEYLSVTQLEEISDLLNSNHSLDRLIFYSKLSRAKTYSDIPGFLSNLKDEGDSIVAQNQRKKINFYYALEALYNLLSYNQLSTKEILESKLQLNFFKDKFSKQNLFGKVDKTKYLLDRTLEYILDIGDSRTKSNSTELMKNTKRIFISHSHKDSVYAEKIVELIEKIGVSHRSIFCSSLPGYGVPLGENFLEEIKQWLNKEIVVIFLLSDKYYKSPISLFEMGASWITARKVFPILIPPLTYKDVQGVFKQNIGFSINDNLNLSIFKEEIEGLFNIEDKLTSVRWEKMKEKVLGELNHEINRMDTVSEDLAESFNEVENNNISIIRENDFEAVIESENNGNILLYKLKKNSKILTYEQVLNLWIENDNFLYFYNNLFRKCGFYSYIWETPPVTKSSFSNDFQFAILNTPSPANIIPDRVTYKKYFDSNNDKNGIVTFLNLGRDTLLIVPSPFRTEDDYSNLDRFYRYASRDQQKSIWKVTANEIKMRITDKPIWVSVAGGGISWLHIRLDPRPKYYRYTPFRTPKN
ncbi:MAG TPA: toll/interleukin-1 receptor domain-containing protein [Eudoraea sp.]|nr:toll/interleukin-1 receptor domain-containing protein [Eudoraea sp.]